MDQINWQPGEEGKGLVDEDGHVHAWPLDDYEVHNDYVKENPSIGSPRAYFEIEPSGKVDLIYPSAADDLRLYDAMAEIIQDADPHFRVDTGEPAWAF